MTLFKQLFFLIALLLTTLFAAAVGINFKSTADSLQKQLHADAKNTAASLSLSLASANGNLSMMATIINANFDNGTYKNITLLDMNGELLYERHNEDKAPEVPKWFMGIVPIKASIASANVSSGWNPIGIIYVQSGTAETYAQLYRILNALTLSFLLLFIVALALLYLLLSLLLKPLKDIRSQAEAILNNKFIVQEKLPYTQDFREVASALNTMVKKG